MYFARKWHGETAQVTMSIIHGTHSIADRLPVSVDADVGCNQACLYIWKSLMHHCHMKHVTVCDSYLWPRNIDRTHIMTSSNGNIFRVTGPLCWEFTGHWWIPLESPSQRPVTRSFDVFFDLRLNKRLSKQSRRWWFGTPQRSLWRHGNDFK